MSCFPLPHDHDHDHVVVHYFGRVVTIAVLVAMKYVFYYLFSMHVIININMKSAL